MRDFKIFKPFSRPVSIQGQIDLIGDFALKFPVFFLLVSYAIPPHVTERLIRFDETPRRHVIGYRKGNLVLTNNLQSLKKCYVKCLYLHQPESHQLSLQQGLSVSEKRTHRSDPKDTWVR